MFNVEKDGVVGAWHRWVIISVAAVVFYTYAVLVILDVIMGATGLWNSFGFTRINPLDWRVLLYTIPYGVLRGENCYKRDLAENGSLNANR
jgi:hypothetical protein